jgi:hypothetical protein
MSANVKASKICSRAGHEWPLLGRNLHGEAVWGDVCVRCGRIHGHRRELRVMSEQLWRAIQSEALRRAMPWWKRLYVRFMAWLGRIL